MLFLNRATWGVQVIPVIPAIRSPVFGGLLTFLSTSYILCRQPWRPKKKLLHYPSQVSSEIQSLYFHHGRKSTKELSVAGRAGERRERFRRR